MHEEARSNLTVCCMCTRYKWVCLISKPAVTRDAAIQLSADTMGAESKREKRSCMQSMVVKAHYPCAAHLAGAADAVIEHVSD